MATRRRQSPRSRWCPTKRWCTPPRRSPCRTSASPRSGAVHARTPHAERARSRPTTTSRAGVRSSFQPMPRTSPSAARASRPSPSPATRRDPRTSCVSPGCSTRRSRSSTSPTTCPTPDLARRGAPASPMPTPISAGAASTPTAAPSKPSSPPVGRRTRTAPGRRSQRRPPTPSSPWPRPRNPAARSCAPTLSCRARWLVPTPLLRRARSSRSTRGRIDPEWTPTMVDTIHEYLPALEETIGSPMPFVSLPIQQVARTNRLRAADRS